MRSYRETNRFSMGWFFLFPAVSGCSLSTRCRTHKLDFRHVGWINGDLLRLRYYFEAYEVSPHERSKRAIETN